MYGIVIFGASGDLAKKKLFPSLATLPNEDIQIIAYARSDMERTFHSHLKEYMEYDENFLRRVKYLQGSYEDLSPLSSYLEASGLNSVFYLSVPPHIYPVILRELESFPPSLVGIEKPFGTDLSSFDRIREYKKHRQLFIDHYLLKPEMVAWPAIAPSIPLLARKLGLSAISGVVAYFCEEIAVENGRHFDTVGVVMDVVQNHLIELFSSVVALFSSDCRDLQQARADIISLLSFKTARYGQYVGYASKIGDKTEACTAALIDAEMANAEHYVVPVRFVAGKALREKLVAVSLHIKREYYEEIASCVDIREGPSDILGMRVEFFVHPQNGVLLRVDTAAGTKDYVVVSEEEIKKVQHSVNGILQGHAVVFEGICLGKEFPSASENEVHASWTFLKNLPECKGPDLVFYEKNTGVEELIKMLE